MFFNKYYMNNLNFKFWILEESKKDIFGFEKETKEVKDVEEKYVIKVDKIKKFITKNIGNKYPNVFGNDIIWSNQTDEKLKVTFSPYGSLRTILKKQIKNKIGENVWITKHVYPLPDSDKNVSEENLADEILKTLHIMNKEQSESVKEKVDLKKIVIKASEQIKFKRPCRWMVFDKIKQINENHYLIMLELTGSGLESSSGSGANNKIEQYHINFIYSEETGLIKCFGASIESPKNSSRWIPGVSDFEEYFAPKQNIKEVIYVVFNSLKTF